MHPNVKIMTSEEATLLPDSIKAGHISLDEYLEKYPDIQPTPLPVLPTRDKKLFPTGVRPNAILDKNGRDITREIIKVTTPGLEPLVLEYIRSGSMTADEYMSSRAEDPDTATPILDPARRELFRAAFPPVSAAAGFLANTSHPIVHRNVKFGAGQQASVLEHIEAGTMTMEEFLLSRSDNQREAAAALGTTRLQMLRSAFPPVAIYDDTPVDRSYAKDEQCHVHFIPKNAETSAVFYEMRRVLTPIIERAIFNLNEDEIHEFSLAWTSFTRYKMSIVALEAAKTKELVAQMGYQFTTASFGDGELTFIVRKKEYYGHGQTGTNMSYEDTPQSTRDGRVSPLGNFQVARLAGDSGTGPQYQTGPYIHSSRPGLAVGPYGVSDRESTANDRHTSTPKGHDIMTSTHTSLSVSKVVYRVPKDQLDSYARSAEPDNYRTSQHEWDQYGEHRRLTSSRVVNLRQRWLMDSQEPDWQGRGMAEKVSMRLTTERPVFRPKSAASLPDVRDYKQNGSRQAGLKATLVRGESLMDAIDGDKTDFIRTNQPLTARVMKHPTAKSLNVSLYSIIEEVPMGTGNNIGEAPSGLDNSFAMSAQGGERPVDSAYDGLISGFDKTAKSHSLQKKLPTTEKLRRKPGMTFSAPDILRGTYKTATSRSSSRAEGTKSRMSTYPLDTPMLTNREVIIAAKKNLHKPDSGTTNRLCRTLKRQGQVSDFQVRMREDTTNRPVSRSERVSSNSNNNRSSIASLTGKQPVLYRTVRAGNKVATSIDTGMQGPSKTVGGNKENNHSNDAHLQGRQNVTGASGILKPGTSKKFAREMPW